MWDWPRIIQEQRQFEVKSGRCCKHTITVIYEERAVRDKSAHTSTHDALEANTEPPTLQAARRGWRRPIRQAQRAGHHPQRHRLPTIGPGQLWCLGNMQFMDLSVTDAHMFNS
ncbi:hypothetical protein E2C01_031331 [Portunus trituberculatus]|uniref:Uncharacterized protein n=1 Tax=Portunus trituberculatus TaxID=210409 RepID=A0A5B7EXU4_PORTR|nr:hypothetical protein [Portunus trituberculatus]